ncbi:serine hydrolase domain-containing protein [candidate division KSB1 bacterium]
MNLGGTPSASLFFLGTFAFSCNEKNNAAPQENNYTPQVPEQVNDGWETGSVEEAGINPEPLIQAVENILNNTYPRVHSILIIKNGKLVFEEYFRGQVYVNSTIRFGPHVMFDREKKHNLASVTKSITSALTGAAIKNGFITDENEKVSTFFPEYQNLFDTQKEKITIEHLLMMESGLDWDENTEMNSDNDMYLFNAAGDPLRFLISMDIAGDPGTIWCYNGGAVTLLGKIIEKASGLNLEEFSEQYLFTPMGISDFRWPYIKPDLIAAHGDLKLRPRDMAKIGQMYLNGGVWEGEQIVTAEWVEKSTAGAFQSGYGYLWWGRNYNVNGEPIRSYAARGWGGQHISVLPDLDMVVVFTGGNYDSNTPEEYILEHYILPACVE